MKSYICPFCGVATNVPHETQQVCIEALHEEIDRTKHVLETVTEPLRGPAIVIEEKEPQRT